MKGIIYSLLSIIIAGFILLLFWSTLPQPVTITGVSTTTRVSFLDNEVRRWENYVDKAAQAATREALNYLTLDNPNFVQPDPSYTLWTVPEVQDAISECLQTGTQSLSPAPACYVDPSRSLSGRLDAYKRLARSHLNIDVDWTLGNVTVEDFQPFQLRVSFELNATFNDTLFAFWNLTRTYTSIVSVNGLPDPLFKRFRVGGGPNGQLLDAADTLRIIRRFPVPRSVMSEENISAMINGSYYADDKGFAPTYLQRLAGIYDEGALDPDAKAGIETLTNLTIWDNLPGNAPHYAAYNLSFTGHQMLSWYKTGGYPGGHPRFPCAIKDGTYAVYNIVPHNFRLDAPRLARYNVDNASHYNLSCEE